jgi:hypothetical protein
MSERKTNWPRLVGCAVVVGVILVACLATSTHK